MGHDEADHGRAEERQDARGDPRLLRGRAEPGHDGDERLGAPEPAWWLNLQTQPNAEVELKSGTRAVRARAAVGEERERLWARFREFGDNPDDYAYRRPGRTEVVVLEPVAAAEAQVEV